VRRFGRFNPENGIDRGEMDPEQVTSLFADRIECFFEDRSLVRPVSVPVKRESGILLRAGAKTRLSEDQVNLLPISLPYSWAI
jgi:hypothetical protein